MAHELCDEHVMFFSNVDGSGKNNFRLVPAYPLGFMDYQYPKVNNNYISNADDEADEVRRPRWNNLCNDQDETSSSSSMFRIVIKSHFTLEMAQQLLNAIDAIIQDACSY